MFRTEKGILNNERIRRDYLRMQAELEQTRQTLQESKERHANTIHELFEVRSQLLSAQAVLRFINRCFKFFLTLVGISAGIFCWSFIPQLLDQSQNNLDQGSGGGPPDIPFAPPSDAGVFEIGPLDVQDFVAPEGQACQPNITLMYSAPLRDATMTALKFDLNDGVIRIVRPVEGYFQRVGIYDTRLLACRTFAIPLQS